MYTLSDFDFALPEELIAQQPCPERSCSRLLDGRSLPPRDRVFRELPQLLRAGDLLVFNDTRVIKARLWGHKGSGGRVELLVERVQDDGTVLAHLRVSKKPAAGSTLALDAAPAHADDHPQARVLGRWPDAKGQLFRLELSSARGDSAFGVMERHGHVPLPPYITHEDTALDSERYQTVFARNPGAVAAPTAALHFDEALLAQLQAAGVERASVTLHVGAGTFAPVKTEDLRAHQMHRERCSVSPATAAAIAACRQRGGRVVAVGTTTVRTLESWARDGAPREGWQADTDIFITPGFAFQVVDLLITNFHLPRSTLLMLVSAFTGHAAMHQLYQAAVARGYRFFSYGDAMLLQRAPPAAAA